MQRWKRFTWVVSLFFGLTGSGFAAGYCAVPALDVLESVVRVHGYQVEGSGVVIAKNRVVTAAHVIKDVGLLNVSVGGIQRYAELISLSPERDLALLKVNTMEQRPIPLNYLPLEPFDTVWAVGYPLGGDQLASRGVYEGALNGYGDLQTTASVNHGQSGGGLIACIDGQHVLAGVISAFGAINMGDHYIRLDDYSISVPIEDVMALMFADAEPY